MGIAPLPTNPGAISVMSAGPVSVDCIAIFQVLATAESSRVI